MSVKLIEEKPLFMLNIPTGTMLTNDLLYEICQINRDMRIERNAQGDLIIMPPTGGKSGARNFNLTGIFSVWVRQDKSGVGFDSSTGFMLPNKALRSPDAAWLSMSKWNSLSEDEKEKFLPLCPDFVIELRSPTDSLSALQEKMQEYIDNGASLGWLIDPKTRKVYIYQVGVAVICLDSPKQISADPLLKNFTLELSDLW